MKRRQFYRIQRFSNYQLASGTGPEGTSLANTGDGRAKVYLVVQSQQIDAGFSGIDPLRDGSNKRNGVSIEKRYRGGREEWRTG
jgi:hypothetical protein